MYSSNNWREKNTAGATLGKAVIQFTDCKSLLSQVSRPICVARVGKVVQLGRLEQKRRGKGRQGGESLQEEEHLENSVAILGVSM